MSEASITLTCYGPASALAGGRTHLLRVAEGDRVAELRRQLAAEMPDLAPMLPRCAVAIGGSIVEDTALLRDGDAVDLLPPVSGG